MEGNCNCTPLCPVHNIVCKIPCRTRFPKLPPPFKDSNWNCVYISNFSSTFLLYHLSHCLSAHHPPTFTHHFSCPICLTVFQLTTHHHSLTISQIPSVPLSFSPPPTTIRSPFLLSHLSHFLSAHHQPPFTRHFSCPICLTLFQLTTHHHSLTISPVP